MGSPAQVQVLSASTIVFLFFVFAQASCRSYFVFFTWRMTRFDVIFFNPEKLLYTQGSYGVDKDEDSRTGLLYPRARIAAFMRHDKRRGSTVNVARRQKNKCHILSSCCCRRPRVVSWVVQARGANWQLSLNWSDSHKTGSEMAGIQQAPVSGGLDSCTVYSAGSYIQAQASFLSVQLHGPLFRFLLDLGNRTNQITGGEWMVFKRPENRVLHDSIHHLSSSQSIRYMYRRNPAHWETTSLRSSRISSDC